MYRKLPIQTIIAVQCIVQARWALSLWALVSFQHVKTRYKVVSSCYLLALRLSAGDIDFSSDKTFHSRLLATYFKNEKHVGDFYM